MFFIMNLDLISGAINLWLVCVCVILFSHMTIQFIGLEHSPDETVGWMKQRKKEREKQTIQSSVLKVSCLIEILALLSLSFLFDQIIDNLKMIFGFSFAVFYWSSCKMKISSSRLHKIQLELFRNDNQYMLRDTIW